MTALNACAGIACVDSSERMCADGLTMQLPACLLHGTLLDCFDVEPSNSPRQQQTYIVLQVRAASDFFTFRVRSRTDAAQKQQARVGRR